MLAHLAGDVGRHHMAISQFHPESRVGQGLGDLAFHLDRIFFGHGACIALRGGADWSTKRTALTIQPDRRAIAARHRSEKGSPAAGTIRRASPPRS